MASPNPIEATPGTVYAYYLYGLRSMVYAMAVVSGLGILLMMGLTCVEIIVRLFKHSIYPYDIVKITGAVTISCALPYTTAVKGHVAIEFFFHKLSRRWRILVDTTTRSLAILLFSLLAWRCFAYGTTLLQKGEVTLTLQIPTYWIMYFISFSCVLVVLIIFEHMLHPGKELIKP